MRNPPTKEKKNYKETNARKYKVEPIIINQQYSLGCQQVHISYTCKMRYQPTILSFTVRWHKVYGLGALSFWCFMGFTMLNQGTVVRLSWELCGKEQEEVFEDYPSICFGLERA